MGVDFAWGYTDKDIFYKDDNTIITRYVARVRQPEKTWEHQFRGELLEEAWNAYRRKLGCLPIRKEDRSPVLDKLWNSRIRNDRCACCGSDDTYPADYCFDGEEEYGCGVACNECNFERPWDTPAGFSDYGNFPPGHPAIRNR